VTFLQARGDVKGCTYTAFPESAINVTKPLMLVLFKTPSSSWDRVKLWLCALFNSDYTRRRLVAEFG
jgi:hypothetical protein